MGLVLYPDDYTGSVLSGTVATLPEGVVFLPAAGSREDSAVEGVDYSGFYWSSTARNAGYSVRLVTDAN